MASKLPFVVSPRLKPVIEVVGTEESGKFEIERRGYLTATEKAFVQGALGSDSTAARVQMLAAKIAKAKKKTQAQVFADFGTHQPYMAEYEDEIATLLAEMVSYQEKYRIVASTALLLSRLRVDWDVTDTMTLHPDILDELTKLYEDEDRKSLEKLEASIEHDEETTVEEAEGKK